MKINITMNIRTKFEMEFPFETTISKLYEYISTDYGLAKWFAKKVEAQEDEDIFRWEWDDIIVHTTLIKKVKNKSHKNHETNHSKRYKNSKVHVMSP